jgi:hypothetical protein
MAQKKSNRAAKSHTARSTNAIAHGPTAVASIGTQLPYAKLHVPKPVSPTKTSVPLRGRAKDATKNATVADTLPVYTAPAVKSASNAVSDTTQSLQTFTLANLTQYTEEQAYSTNASSDVHLFYVGRDDVHDILKYILSRVRNSLYINMFGFDDAELNDILMQKAMDPNVTMMITLDLSQSKGIHEKALLAADEEHNLAKFNTYFTLGQSATHQISHTKGFVADGRVAAEGSTNWSSSGEGTFVVHGQPGGSGYKAQNNTQSVISDPDTITRFQTELIAEHMTAKNQEKGTGVGQKSVPATTTAKSAPAKNRGTKKNAAEGASLEAAA